MPSARRITMHLGEYGGIAVRVQGLRRYYGVRLTRAGQLEIIRVRDDRRRSPGERADGASVRDGIDVLVQVAGAELTAEVGGTRLQARDDSPLALTDGGIGLFVADGALSANSIDVAPP